MIQQPPFPNSVQYMFQIVPFTSYLRYTSTLKKWRFVDFGRYYAHQTGSDVTNGKLDHGFLYAFHTHFLSSRRHSAAISVFLIFYYGEIAISTARRRLRPEVTSPNDISFQHVFRVYCVPFTSYRPMRFSSRVIKWRFVDFGR
jgi:hypothetical protein